MSELEFNISATDVTKSRTWEQTSCKPPSCQGHHQMSGKTITVLHRCEGGVLCCMKRPPQLSIHPPWPMHAIFFALTRQEGGCVPAVAAQTTTQMPKYSCHCIHALIASMPTLSGRAHGSAYNYGAEMGKRLHSSINVAHGDIRKERIVLVLNSSLMFDDVRVWICNHSRRPFKPLRLCG